MDTPACHSAPRTRRAWRPGEGLFLTHLWGGVRLMVGAGQAKFWLKLHNPVTSTYKVRAVLSVERV